MVLLVGIQEAKASDLTGIAEVSGGQSITCGLTTTGGVKCWGGGAPATPRDVPGLSANVAVIAAGEPSCALLADGTVKCWDGADQTPVDVAGLPAGAAGIAASASHRCALTGAGGVMCWGRNFSGQIGDGTTVDRSAPTAVTGLSSGVIRIDLADQRSCAIMTGGGVKCWGDNQYGQLGDGTTTSRSTPVDVLGLSGAVSMIASDFAQTCALLTSGGVKCWGQGATTPTDVPGLAGVTMISAGDGHIGVLTASGGVKCWGSNTNGQLGDGTFIDRSTPVDVIGLGEGVTSIGAGWLHSCAVVAGGKVRCWGHYKGGQFGGNSGGNWPLPQRVGDFIEQGITFAELPARILGDAPFQISAAATSGLPVSFTSLAPSVCTVSGATVTLVASGVCRIEANQPGDSQYGGAYPTARGFRTIDVHTARLANISTRAPVFSGASAMIAGFVIGGSTNKSVAIVAAGWSLGSHGISNPVANPRLQVVRQSDHAIVAANDTWYYPYRFAVPDYVWSYPDAAALVDIGLDPDEWWEPALIANLAPGAYTVLVTPDGSSSSGSTAAWPSNLGGIGLAAVYELDHPETPLLNISTRSEVLTGDNVMIAGFVIQGDNPRTVAIVGTGPSLSASGIANPLGDPTVTLVRQSDHAILAANDNWQQASNADQIQSRGFAPSNALESAILVTLPPGAYTAILSGAGGTTGIGVLGVYDAGP